MSSFPEANDWRDVGWLDRLARVRAPVEPLNRQIMARVGEQWLSSIGPENHCLEVGAGDGKLRDWLPPDWLGHVVHSEPSEEFCRQFRERFPTATLSSASVYDLPFEAGSFAAVLGLCVLDALDDLEAAREQIRRVLRPGGRLVHFLDLGLACMDDILKSQIRAGDVPFPNFVSDHALNSPFASDQASLLNDLMVCRRTRLLEIAQYLTDSGNPLGRTLSEYDRRFHGSAREMSDWFMSFTNDLRQRESLRQLVGDIERLVGCYPNLSWDWKPVSSIEQFQARLERCFAPAHGFQVELSRVLVARDWQPRPPEFTHGERHLARIVGQVAIRNTPTPLDCGELVFTGSGSEDDSNMLVESGLHLFVATAIPPRS